MCFFVCFRYKQQKRIPQKIKCPNIIPVGVKYQFWENAIFNGKFVLIGIFFLFFFFVVFVVFFDLLKNFLRKVRKRHFCSVYETPYISSKIIVNTIDNYIFGNSI